LVDDLRERLRKAKDVVNELEKELDCHVNTLQAICIHDFEGEDDGDHHRARWYYTCKHCRFFTRQRPAKIQKK
jgi:hypothetical protein